MATLQCCLKASKAVKNGHLNCLEIFYDAEDLDNLLDLAVSNGKLDIVKYLIIKGEVLKKYSMEIVRWDGRGEKIPRYILDRNTKDLLVTATRKGYLEIVIYLIDIGFTTARCLLYAAIDEGHLELVEYLIKTKYRSEYDLLSIAITGKRIEIVKCLIENGFRSEKDILRSVVIDGPVDFVKYLVEKGFTSQQYLCDMAFEKWRKCTCCWLVDIYAEITIYLIEKGFKYSQDLPLRAASGGNLEVLKCLAFKGVELNYNLYKKAAYNGHLHIIEYLPKTCDPRFLLDAAKCGHLHIIEYALKNGIPLNKYIFIKAAKRGHLKIVEFGFATVGQWWRPQFGEIHSMHRDILIAAIKKDRPKIFEYALNNGVSFDEDAIEIAVEEWSLNVLKFACTTRYKDDVCMMVARYGYLDIIEHAYGKEVPQSIMAQAAKHGHVNIVKYAHENGTPLYKEICEDVVNGCFIFRPPIGEYEKVFEYAHANGCDCEYMKKIYPYKVFKKTDTWKL